MRSRRLLVHTPNGDIWIGTSGWQYDHWRGRFYVEVHAVNNAMTLRCLLAG